MPELESGRGLGCAWSEASALFQLAKASGAYENVRRDILPNAETDPGMAVYRRIVATFYDSFVRRGKVPSRMPHFHLPVPATPRSPRPQRTWKDRLGDDKIAAIRDALLAGLSILEITNTCHTSRGTIHRVRIELEEAGLVGKLERKKSGPKKRNIVADDAGVTPNQQELVHA